MPQQLTPRPQLGFGLGLRRELVAPILDQLPPVDWLEILTDSYLQADRQTLDALERIRAHYPLALHGGALSLGGPDPIDPNYLARLAALARRLEPQLISDHLCWTPPGMSHSYDLRPLPRTREMLDHLVPRITQVQEALGRRILVENIADPHPQPAGQMGEAEFLTVVAEAADCLILLDLNNVITNGLAQGFRPRDYLERLPGERIWQIHLAPLMHRSEYEWDANTSHFKDPVWQLYREVVRQLGPIATLLERNDDIPPLQELLLELEQARQVAKAGASGAAVP